MVYLKLQPYRMRSLARKPNEKLAPRFFGPYKVLQQVGKVAYRLDLPAYTTIHPVFHVSQLKRAIGDHMVFQLIPAALTEEMVWMVKPAEVKDCKMRLKGQEVLIFWKDLPEFEATWESVKDISLQFSDFHLGDKVSSLEGEN